MAVTFKAQVKSVQVKSKTVKEKIEGGTLEHVEAVGVLTLEFDSIDATQQLADMIGDQPIVIGLADTQMRLDDAMRDLQ